MRKWFQNCNFKLVLRIDILSISCEIALRRMPQNPFDDTSTLVQVMDWCRLATSHYLIQCWPKFMLPYGITRPQWVNYSMAVPQIHIRLHCRQSWHDANFVVTGAPKVVVMTTYGAPQWHLYPGGSYDLNDLTRRSGHLKWSPHVVPVL